MLIYYPIRLTAAGQTPSKKYRGSTRITNLCVKAATKHLPIKVTWRFTYRFTQESLVFIVKRVRKDLITITTTIDTCEHTKGLCIIVSIAPKHLHRSRGCSIIYYSTLVSTGLLVTNVPKDITTNRSFRNTSNRICKLLKNLNKILCKWSIQIDAVTLSCRFM